MTLPDNTSARRSPGSRPIVYKPQSSPVTYLLDLEEMRKTRLRANSEQTIKEAKRERFTTLTEDQLFDAAKLLICFKLLRLFWKSKWNIVYGYSDGQEFEPLLPWRMLRQSPFRHICSIKWIWAMCADINMFRCWLILWISFRKGKVHQGKKVERQFHKR